MKTHSLPTLLVGGTLVALMSVVWVNPAPAQSTSPSMCASVLEHAAYDYARTQYHAKSNSDYRSSLCDRYESVRSSGTRGNAGVTYGIFGASGSLSHQELMAQGKLLCESNAKSDADLRDISSDLKKVNPDAMEAFKECLRLSASSVGLIVGTDYRADGRHFDIDVKYLVPGGGSTSLKQITMMPPGTFQCSGPLVSMINGGRLDAQSKSMSCERNVSATPDGFTVAGASTITIHTDAGKIVRSFSEISPPRIRAAIAVPIGTVLPWAGPVSTVPAGWLPCDGRPLPKADYMELFKAIGNTYGETNTDFKIPDLRGRFVRGVDDGAGNDPDASTRQKVGGGSGGGIGSLQEFATAQARAAFSTESSGVHEHNLNFEFNARRSDGGTPNTVAFPYISSSPRRTTDSAGAHTHKILGGDRETRPSNIALYHVIHVGILKN